MPGRCMQRHACKLRHWVNVIIQVGHCPAQIFQQSKPSSCEFLVVPSGGSSLLPSPLTIPQVDPRLTASLAECLHEFGGGRSVALYSNSAGLEQYDPQGEWGVLGSHT
eukprot:scaffold41706_cov17-Tisochrysis_lutea.AAC.3